MSKIYSFRPEDNQKCPPSQKSNIANYIMRTPYISTSAAPRKATIRTVPESRRRRRPSRTAGGAHDVGRAGPRQCGRRSGPSGHLPAATAQTRGRRRACCADAGWPQKPVGEHGLTPAEKVKERESLLFPQWKETHKARRVPLSLFAANERVFDARAEPARDLRHQRPAPRGLGPHPLGAPAPGTPTRPPADGAEIPSCRPGSAPAAPPSLPSLLGCLSPQTPPALFPSRCPRSRAKTSVSPVEDHAAVHEHLVPSEDSASLRDCTWTWLGDPLGAAKH